VPCRLFEPCIPTRGTKVPAGPDWIHEIKHDGYRLIVQRDGKKRVRLFTRNGHDWTERYPLIVKAALKNPVDWLALHRNDLRVFNPDRKDTHWGKWKLKRDR
jgi:ATP-dependent DNA ligase